MIDDANQLARCLGYSADDGMTYGMPIWQDALGNRYAVASGIVSDAFPAAAASPLILPPWGADLEAASRAQAAITIGLPADPSKLAAVFGDAMSAVAILALTRMDDE
jgi:hypothetical protein